MQSFLFLNKVLIDWFYWLIKHTLLLCTAVVFAIFPVFYEKRVLLFNSRLSLKISPSLQHSIISPNTSKPFIYLSLLELACTLPAMGLGFAPSSLQPPNQLSPDQCAAQPSISRLGQGPCHLFYLEPDPCLTMDVRYRRRQTYILPDFEVDDKSKSELFP